MGSLPGRFEGHVVEIRRKHRLVFSRQVGNVGDIGRIRAFFGNFQIVEIQSRIFGGIGSVRVRGEHIDHQLELSAKPFYHRFYFKDVSRLRNRAALENFIGAVIRIFVRSVAFENDLRIDIYIFRADLREQAIRLRHFSEKRRFKFQDVLFPRLHLHVQIVFIGVERLFLPAALGGGKEIVDGF